MLDISLCSFQIVHIIKKDSSKETKYAFKLSKLVVETGLEKSVIFFTESHEHLMAWKYALESYVVQTSVIEKEY